MGKKWVDTGSRNVEYAKTRKPDYTCGQCENWHPCPCGCRHGTCEMFPDEGMGKSSEAMCDYFELAYGW